MCKSKKTLRGDQPSPQPHTEGGLVPRAARGGAPTAVASAQHRPCALSLSHAHHNARVRRTAWTLPIHRLRPTTCHDIDMRTAHTHNTSVPKYQTEERNEERTKREGGREGGRERRERALIVCKRTAAAPEAPPPAQTTPSRPRNARPSGADTARGAHRTPVPSSPRLTTHKRGVWGAQAPQQQHKSNESPGSPAAGPARDPPRSARRHGRGGGPRPAGGTFS